MNREIESFQTRLIRHLLKALRGRSEPFINVLARSENCDPAFLVGVLQEMEARGLVRVNDKGTAREYELTAHVKARTCNSHERYEPTQLPSSKRLRHGLLHSDYFGDIVRGILRSLPEPSLVHSQWWFSEPTYVRLTNLILRLVRKDAHVAFVGSSTLGAVFSHCVTSPATIIDVDEVLLSRIKSCADEPAQFLCRDISDPLDTSLKHKFDLVFADPPWSSSSLKAFFVRTSEMLAREGTLVISFPPVFTRPSAQVDRKALLRMAKLLGISFTTEFKGFTEYNVPQFEHNAYREYGIELNQPWRTGDIFIFRKQSKGTECEGIPVEACYKWDQYDYGVMRLFLKRNGSVEEGPARIVPVFGKNEFAYNSTSSRTQLWKQACLVSTRNQIADVSGTKQLRVILEGFLGKTTTVGNGIGRSRNIRPETRAALSILLNDSAGRESRQRENKWHRQEESYSHSV